MTSNASGDGRKPLLGWLMDYIGIIVGRPEQVIGVAWREVKPPTSTCKALRSVTRATLRTTTSQGPALPPSIRDLESRKQAGTALHLNGTRNRPIRTAIFKTNTGFQIHNTTIGQNSIVHLSHARTSTLQVRRIDPPLLSVKVA